MCGRADITETPPSKLLLLIDGLRILLRCTDSIIDLRNVAYRGDGSKQYRDDRPCCRNVMTIGIRSGRNDGKATNGIAFKKDRM